MSSVSVYIDGFNFYYGCLKGKNHLKWLDFRLLSNLIIQSNKGLNHKISKVYFFTALLKNTVKKQRQEIYLEALKTKNITIKYGQFISNPIRLPLVANKNQTVLCKNCNSKNDKVEVRKNEEKGTDVNLTTQLLIDTFENKFDIAMVFTNDSDFLEPLKKIKKKFKKTIYLINPNQHPTSFSLDKEIGFLKTGISEKVVGISKKLLKQSQLPETIRVNENRQVTRPKKWQ